MPFDLDVVLKPPLVDEAELLVEALGANVVRVKVLEMGKKPMLKMLDITMYIFAEVESAPHEGRQWFSSK